MSAQLQDEQPAIGQRLEEKLIEYLDFAPRCGTRLQPVDVDPFGGRVLKGQMPGQCTHDVVAEVWCRTCGKHDLACADHQAAILAETAMVCGLCKTTAPGAALMDFRPLGGA